MKLKEHDLEIDFTNALDAFVFDQMHAHKPNYHGIAEMHRVDFIVELDSEILFVEIKDPSNPNAQAPGLQKFYDKLNSGTLSNTFASKFIDTFLYRWAERKVLKPVHYLSLVTLETEQLPNFSDQITRAIPPMGKKVPRWNRQLVYNCQVFNIETWNGNFPKWPVTRISLATCAGGP